jgi:phosphatidylglycerol lysyltransferase
VRERVLREWFAGSVALAAVGDGGGQRSPVPRLLRMLGPPGLVLLCAWAAWDGLRAVDWGLVRAELAGVSPPQWAAALAATLASYLAIGRHDAVLHRVMQTGFGGRRAALSGMAAIAVSQTTGFGPVVGALVRWRLLPGLGPAAALRLTLAVTLSFLLGWAVVMALAVQLLLPAGAPWEAALRAGAALIISAFACIVGLCLWRPVLEIGAWRLTVPPLRTGLRIFGLTAADTLAAGLVLHALLPPDAAPALAAFLPAFLVALGAGLLSGTPGGIGPFEVVLAALLPGVGAEPLAAAILGYRAVYFAGPAVLAGAFMAFGPAGPARSGRAPVPGNTDVHDQIDRVRGQAPRAESLILAQGEHAVLQGAAGGGWLVGRSGQVLAALFEPFGGPDATALLPDLARCAAAEDRVPCLYKIGARSALAARRAGWAIQPVAEEFWLCPADFGLASPARAGLRRKLRHAAAAGVTVRSWRPGEDPEALPWPEMAALARCWAARRRGERGFSMGRFERHYLGSQRLYLAHADGVLLAFASFHQGRHEWALDLMRQAEGIADGTMAALIVRAMEEAAAAGVPRLSLAAVPLPDFGLAGRLGRFAQGHDPNAGLRRFKAGFAPHRSRLYLAAPTRAGLMIAAADLARAIRWPAPLPQGETARSRPATNPAQHLPDELAFE